MVRPQDADLQRLKSGLYGVLGSSIAYTRSPSIFRAVFAHMKWPATYARFDRMPRELERFLRAAPEVGIVGLNVTIPYKRRVRHICDRLAPSARLTGAVNAVSYVNRRTTGHNTDIDGVRATLRRYRRGLTGAHAVVFGAGGAARAVAWTLLSDFRIGRLSIVGRSRRKADDLLATIAGAAKGHIEADALGWSDHDVRMAVADAALIVNATPLGGGLFKGVSPLSGRISLPDATIVFDLVYEPPETLLLKQARAARCRVCINGWPMLVAQAEASFRIWTGRGFPGSVTRMLLTTQGRIG
ncbi:MAG TPA: shikimate dehydrogenase [candidate division Zixibacteria bacterium]|jgi:shikimate dehydrogenase